MQNSYEKICNFVLVKIASWIIKYLLWDCGCKSKVSDHIQVVNCILYFFLAFVGVLPLMYKLILLLSQQLVSKSRFWSMEKENKFSALCYSFEEWLNIFLNILVMATHWSWIFLVCEKALILFENEGDDKVKTYESLDEGRIVRL